MTITADADALATPPSAQTAYRPAHSLDLNRTISVLRRGPSDPTMMAHGGRHWMSFQTAAGIATLTLRQQGDTVHAAAWGPGAEEAIIGVPRLCGADDDPTGFDIAHHPVLGPVAHRVPGIRMTRTDRVFAELAGIILEQKVTGLQAYRAWRYLVTRYGEPAPGPSPRPLFAAPPDTVWRDIPSWAWHRAGVEPSQSRTLVAAAARGASVTRALLSAPTDGDSRDRVLTSLPGIGLWTSAETRMRVLGDADAVAVGDFHLAHHVGYVLTGTRTNDAGMLELLAPWAGHRQRVIRLIHAAGGEPRRAPRLAPMDHRGR